MAPLRIAFILLVIATCCREGTSSTTITSTSTISTILVTSPDSTTPVTSPVTSTNSTSPVTSTRPVTSTDSTSLVTSTSAVISTATTTTPATITMTTTASVSTTRYPIQSPDLGNAVYVFSFKVQVNLNITNINDVLTKVRIAFENVTSFRGVYIINSPGARKKREANREYEIGANFSAAEVQNDGTNFTANVSNAMESLNQTLSQVKGVILQAYADALEKLTSNIADKCKAEPKEELCRDDFYCENNSCRYLCYQLAVCNNGGVCYVQSEPNSGRKPKCRCASDDVYDYSGETCEDSTMKEKWIAAIAGAVGGLLVLILVVLVACFCRQRRRLKKQAEQDKYELAYAPPSGIGYQGLETAKKYRPTYDNQAYQGDVFLKPEDEDTRDHQSQHQYDYPPLEDYQLSEPRPMMTDFFASGQQLKIQRPKLLTRPRHET